MELTSDTFAFSDLVGTRVRDQSGRAIGRVIEARAHWQRGGSVVVDELMVGRRALWQRLRGPAADARGIPWEAVTEIRGDCIVVRR